MAKRLPADMLLMFSNVRSIIYSTRDAWSPTPSLMETTCVPSNLYHELGHAACLDLDEIVKNEELLSTYKKEMAEFDSIHFSKDRDIINYFSLTGGGESDNGLDELIADAFILFTTYAPDKNSLSMRGHYLVKYFPKTISVLAELTGYNNSELWC